MLRTFQVNDKCKPFYTKAALFEGNCEQDPVKRCQDGPVVEGARLKVISWLRDGFRGRVWVFWSPSGGVGSNPTPCMFSILSYRKSGIISRTDAHKFAFTRCRHLIQLYCHELLGVQVVDFFPQNHGPVSQSQNNCTWQFFFARVSYPFGRFCAELSKTLGLVHIRACLSLGSLDKQIGWFCLREVFRCFFFIISAIEMFD